MKRPLESAVQKQCLNLLKLAGVLAWRSNNTGVYDPARKCFRTFHGLRGVADILGVLPGGKFLAVEVKRPGGKVTKGQRRFLDAVAAAGGLTLIVTDVRQLEAALRAEGVM